MYHRPKCKFQGYEENPQKRGQNGCVMGIGKIPYTRYPKHKLLRMDFFKYYKHLFIVFSAKDMLKH